MRPGLLLAILPVLTVAVGAWFGFDVSRAGKLSGFVWLAAPSFIFAAIGVWLTVKKKTARALFKPQWGDLSFGFFVALAMFGLSYAGARLVIGAHKAIWISRLYDQAGDTSFMRDHLVLVALGIISLASAEEIVWRSLVTDALALRFGKRAWIVAAVLYAAAHLPTVWKLSDDMMGKNPLVPFAALGAGLAFGAVVRRTGRLAPAIVAHAIFDWTVIVMFRLYGNSV
ncbi:hypothetical protein BH09MYX1_BH09MYX1_39540 [soil metagenome]